MTTNLPAARDAFVRPVAGDTLLNSDGAGTRSTKIIDDIQDALDEVEKIVVGPVFSNPLGYTPLAGLAITDCEAASGDTPNNATWTTTATGGVSISASHTQGVNSIHTTNESGGGALKSAGRISCDFAGTVPVGAYLSMAMDVMVLDKIADSIYLDATIASATALTGTVSKANVGIVSANSWKTIIVPIGAVASIKSVGLKCQAIPGANSSDTMGIRIDNIRFIPTTGLDQAITAAKTVFIPSGYTAEAGQLYGGYPADHAVLDFRTASTTVPNLNGVKYVRQYGLNIDETGVLDCTGAFNTIFASLVSGDYLMFPKNKLFFCSTGPGVKGNPFIINYASRDVTIDLNGSALIFLWENQAFSVNSSSWTFRNGRVLGIRQEVRGMVADAGSPTFSAPNWVLDAKDEAIRFNSNDPYIRDGYGNVVIDFTLSDTAHVANDVVAEFYDPLAPAPPTAVTTGTDGPIQTGFDVYYWVADVYADYQQSGLSKPVKVTTTSWCRITLTLPAVTKSYPPIISRRIYRAAVATGGPQPGSTVGGLDELHVASTTYVDNQPVGTHTDQPGLISLADGGAGVLPAATYGYFVTSVLTSGQERIFVKSDSPQTKGIVQITIGNARQITVTLPDTGNAGVAQRRVYRCIIDSSGGGINNKSRLFHLIPNGIVNDNTTVSIVDNNLASAIGEVRIPSIDAPDSSDPVGDFGSFTFPLLTSTPTVYRWNWRPGPEALKVPLCLRIRKATATANSISVGAVTSYGRSSYDSANEGGHGFEVFGNNVTLEDLWIEGKSGDGVRSQGENLMARRTVSRACGRQGMSYNGGQKATFEDCKFLEAGRSAFDFEPGSALQTAYTLKFLRCEARSPVNAHWTLHWCDEATLENCWIGTRGGVSTLEAITGGGDQLRIIDCNFRWFNCHLTAMDAYIDGLICQELTLPEVDKVATTNLLQVRQGRNVVIKNSTTAVMPVITLPNARIINHTLDTLPTGETGIEVPPVYALLDRTAGGTDFGGTDKGIIAGPLWFPRGLNALDETVTQVRGISGTSVAANNFGGVVTVSAGATSIPVTFPTHAYVKALFGFPGSGGLSAFADPSGTLAAATYFYKASPRPIPGGPTAVGTELSVVVGGANNSVGLKFAMDAVAGVTIWRGTATGVYTARYDVLPNSDVYKLGTYFSSPSNFHEFADLGSTLNLNKPGVSYDIISYGYPVSFAQTAHVTNPDNWIPVNETGYEADALYSVFATFSWQTTYTVARTRSGFTVTPGVQCPAAGGTMEYHIARVQ